MAKRKKNKLTPQQQQAQFRKSYIRKTITLAEQLGAEDFRLLMTPEMMDSLIGLRNRISLDLSPSVPPELHKAAQALLDDMLKSSEVEFAASDTALSLWDFLSVGQAIYFFVTNEKNRNVKTGRPLGYEERQRILRDRLAEFIHWADEEGEPYQRLNLVLWCVSLTFTELSQQLYWMEQHFEFDGRLLHNRFELHRVRPERRKINLDGGVRPVTRVGWAFTGTGPLWSEVDRARFDNSYQPGEQLLPVFIQSHALRRMEERLDSTDKKFNHVYLFNSLSNAEVVKNQHGQWLIAYRYQGFKLGYLVVEVVEDILVIRTFLFMTMDSTPEGQALRETIGLEAEDKKYLAIDRLSTFLHSDLGNYPDIKAYFLAAGCDDLFNFDGELVDSQDRWEVANFFRRYLNNRPAEASATAEAPSIHVPQESAA